MYLDESYDDNDFESDSGSSTNGTKFHLIINVGDIRNPRFTIFLQFRCSELIFKCM
jgi:hypothetical protein